MSGLFLKNLDSVSDHHYYMTSIGRSTNPGDFKPPYPNLEIVLDPVTKELSKEAKNLKLWLLSNAIGFKSWRYFKQEPN